MVDLVGNKIPVELIQSSTGKLEIDLSSEKSGIYIIKLMINDSVQIARIIKH